MYLKEYETAKFKRPIEIKLLNIPDIVSKFIELLSIYIVELISYIKVAIHIFLLKTISPTSLIARDKLDVKSIIICTINKEKFERIAHRNNLKIN